MIERVPGNTPNNSQPMVRGTASQLTTSEPVRPTEALLNQFLKTDFVEQKEQKQPTKEQVEKVAESLNQFLAPSNTSIKFEFHDELKEYYVTVVNNVSNEIIKEIPSKKLMDIYAAMKDYLGLFIDKKI